MAKKKVVHVEYLLQQVCGNCRHWRRLDDTDQLPSEDVLGDCLRYPPAVVGIEDGEAVQAMPIVEARHKCGEHGGVIN